VSGLDRAAARAANHVLRTAPLAMERLARHAGRTASFAVGPIHVSLTIQTTGEVAGAVPGAAHDLEVRIPPTLLPRLAAREEAAWGEVAMSGDLELGREISFIARNLPWDIEEDLSRVMGDVAAHRTVAAARAAHRWGREAALRLAQGAAEYWTEESPLVASRVKVATFVDEVARLRDDLERLARRIERLG
jgi:ubiquinone biosynthesis protein UbiJ